MSDNLHIVSVETVQTLLMNASPDGQAQISAVVDALSAAFNGHVGYQFRAKTYNDVVLNGGGTGVLILPHPHVTAVTKVEYRQSKNDWTELDDEYWECDDVMHQGVMGYGGYVFAYGRRNWRVTFTAGYELDTMPGPVVEAFMGEVNRWIERRWDLSSKSMSGNANSTTSFLHEDVRRKLAAYMRIGI